jgi:membrane-bound serine protease (ClpP class)
MGNINEETMFRLLCNFRFDGAPWHGHLARAAKHARPKHGQDARATFFLVLLTLLFGLVSLSRGQELPAAGEAGQPIQPPHQHAAIIKLSGDVDQVMLNSVERRIDLARKAGCTLIIYDMDVTGGLLNPAIEISKLNKKLDLPTVAYLHTAAYAAGAIVALSCGQLVMDPKGSLGDCSSIAVEHSHDREPESAVLAEMLDSARVRGWNALLVRAMVVRGTEVIEVRHNITGETRFVTPQERDGLIRELATTPEGKSIAAWRVVASPAADEKAVLTINADEAIHEGFAKARIGSEQELLAVLNVRQQLVPLDFDISEKLERFLVQSGVQFTLFLLMLVLAYIEFSHPGVTLPGIGALICLILLVGAPLLTGRAHAWEIILVAIGLMIVVVDLVVYGGVGLLAVPGFILMAIGIVASFVPSEPGQPWVPQMSGTYVALQTGLSIVVFGTLLAIVIFFGLARYLHMTPGLRRLQLAPVIPGATAAVSDVLQRHADEAVFVGAIGTVVADLHPAGKAQFGDHLVEVSAQGQFVSRGAAVEVIAVAGHNVTVKPRA